jgi:FkbM family methyltransferase
MQLGFASSPTIGAGSFDWRIVAEPRDRLRFGLQRAVMVTSSRLRVRGGPRVSLALAKLVGRYRAPLIAESLPDLRISFDGFDRYWMAVFFRNDLYEPELFRLFSRIQTRSRFSLIDGGANIGFWSAVLTSARFGLRQAIAVEASPTTFETLERTAQLSNGRVVALHRAISSRPGIVSFDQSLNHESRKIVDSSRVDGTVSIEAVTVDMLAANHQLAANELFVKLDVEGAELAAFEGAAEVFERGAILIYEDHGKDPDSKLTGQLVARGARCWFIADDGQLVEVDSAAAASRHKPSRTRGYNFLCVSADYDRHTPLARRLFEPLA